MTVQTIVLTKEQEELITLLSSPVYPPDVARALTTALFTNGWSIKQLIPELPHRSFEIVYDVAKKYYEVGNYNAALSLFYPLCAYDPHSYKYLVGCSACLHLLGYLKEALQGYTLAYAAEPANPIPLFYAAECAEKLNARKQASLLLEQAIAVAGSQKKYQTLKEQADLIKTRLTK